MCYIRIRNPSDAIIFSQREKKRLEEKSPRKKSKISREGTDVAALRKSLLKKTTLEKKREVSRQIRFASKKKRTKMKKMSRDARLPPQNKTRELFCCFPYSFEPSSSFDAKRRERTRRDDTMAR
jgi:hypothetical protein